MGNETSKNNTHHEITINHHQRRPPVHSRDVFTDAEVAELLERQREYFEKQRLKDAQATQLQAQNVPGISSAPHVSPSSVVRPTRYNVETAGSSSSHLQLTSPSASSHPQLTSPSASSHPLLTSPSASSHPQLTSPSASSHPQLTLPSAASRPQLTSPFASSRPQLTSPSGPTLYPNLNTVQNQHQSNVRPSTSADYVFVNSTGRIEKRNMPAPSAPPAPRDRSSSRPRFRKADTEQKGSENGMKCPTCKEMYGLTIFQCSRGHSSCNKCKSHRRACGICSQPITDMRNITMEALICEMKVKCSNAENGCHLFIKMADSEIHSRECPFRELPCPLKPLGCPWTGKLSQVKLHFDDYHQATSQGAVDTEMTSSLNYNSHTVQLVVMGNFHFVFHLIVSKGQGKVYMAVQLIGTNMSASKWMYEIHVYHKGQPRRKYQHIDVCQPLNTNIKDLMSESKCAVLPLCYASTFMSDNKWTYKYYIKKEANDKPSGRNNRGRGGHRR